MYRRIIDRIATFNSAHPWSHNDLYHAWILRKLPGKISRALDVGCGTGNLVRAMSARCESVRGIDLDPHVIAVAQSTSTVKDNVIFAVDDFMQMGRLETFDVVTALAVVHHVDLEEALTCLSDVLCPGGTLVILGCYRSSSIADHLTDLIAVAANIVVGICKSRQSAQALVGLSAPTAEPKVELTEVRRIAARTLPGAKIRRRLFWRYSLLYRKP